jgi:hypothetical protein
MQRKRKVCMGNLRDSYRQGRGKERRRKRMAILWEIEKEHNIRERGR